MSVMSPMESEMPDRAVETVAIITIEGKNIGTKERSLMLYWKLFNL